MSHPGLLLKNQVCFRVYALERRISAAYRPLLADLGLTYPQYLVMLVLWERKEARVGELCQALGLDTGTLSPLLKRLEKRGFVRRKPDPDDERSVLASLTAAGLGLEGRALSIPPRLASCLFVNETEYVSLTKGLDLALERLKGS